MSRKTRPISLFYFATLCFLSSSKRRRSSYALARFIFKTSINCTWFVFICGRIIIFSYFIHNFLFILFVQLRLFFRITNLPSANTSEYLRSRMTTENIKKHNLDFYFHIFLVLCLKCLLATTTRSPTSVTKKIFYSF